jgi:hypothetical protein
MLNAIGSFSSSGLLVGGALLTAGLAFVPCPTHHANDRAPCGLELEVEEETSPTCYYGSVFNVGELYADQCPGSRTVWQQEYDFEDGCTWRATETLLPDGDGFRYSYSEEVASCEPGATPAEACSRTGRVHRHPVDASTVDPF